MKEFVSFGKYHKSMLLMSNRFLKYKIDGVQVPQFQLAYICDKTHTSHKNLVKLCRYVKYMWWENQELELKECEDCVKSKIQEY